MKRYTALIGLFALLGTIAAEPARADFSADSVALIGAWKWTYTSPGMGGPSAQPIRGKDRILSFRKDGTYAQWEQNSEGFKLQVSGTYVIHRNTIHQRSDDMGRVSSFWLEFTGWSPLWSRQLVTFPKSDKILMYPGGGNVSVEDASEVTYVRHKPWREPPMPATASRLEEP